MLLRRTRKWLALAWVDVRYRFMRWDAIRAESVGWPAAADAWRENQRRSIGARYRKPKPKAKFTAIKNVVFFDEDTGQPRQIWVDGKPVPATGKTGKIGK